MITIDLDVNPVRLLAGDFDTAGKKILGAVTPVVSKGALNIKTDAARRITGHPRAVHYPRSISYDLTTEGGEVSAEIGPDKARKQGPLGNILEFGTSKNAPIPHLGPALDAEEAGFIAAVRAAGAKAMLG